MVEPGSQRNTPPADSLWVGAPGGSVNPYPSSAVAGSDDLVTIPTAAVERSLRQLRTYLQEAAAGAAHGQVLALTGEPGMGKTHLSRYLARTAIDSPRGPVVLQVIAGSPDQPFVELFRRLIRQVPQDTLVAAVNRVYRQVIIADLEKSRITRRLAESIRTGQRSVDEVVSEFKLSRSTYEHQLELELRRLTDGDEDFARVLTLLRQPGLTQEAFSWLNGDLFPTALKDRGVDGMLTGRDRHIDAIGHLARVLTAGGGSLLLCIDEVQELVDGVDPDQRATGLRQLLDLLLNTPTFLVVCGLPEFYDVIPTPVQQRLGPVVSLPPFDLDDAEQFVLDTHDRWFRRRELAPFDRDSLQAVIDLAGGVPRLVIRLLWHGFQRHLMQEIAVTPALIAEAARDHIGVVSEESIRRAIIRVVHQRGLEFRPNYRPPGEDSREAELWVFNPADPDAGIAVLVSGAVSSDVMNDVAPDLARHGIRVLLIVEGALPDTKQTQLTTQLGIPPLRYVRRSFESDLGSALADQLSLPTPAGTAGAAGAAAPIPADLAQQLQLVERRQILTHEFVLELSQHVEALRMSSESRLDALRSELRTTHTTGQAEPEVGSALPPDVDGLFRQAQDDVTAVSRINGILNASFQDAAFRPDEGYGMIQDLRARILMDGVTSGIGVAAILGALLGTFETAVLDWFTQWSDHPNQDRAAALSNLRSTCRKFDAIYEYLPLSQLGRLSELSTYRRGAADPVADVNRYVAGHGVRELLDGFGNRVFAGILGYIDEQPS